MEASVLIETSYFFPVPVQQRYVVAVMMLLGCINMFTLRVSLSVAIVEMTTPTEDAVKFAPDSTCPIENDNATEQAAFSNYKIPVLQKVSRTRNKQCVIGGQSYSMLSQHKFGLFRPHPLSTTTNITKYPQPRFQGITYEY